MEQDPEMNALTKQLSNASLAVPTNTPNPARNISAEKLAAKLAALENDTEQEIENTTPEKPVITFTKSYFSPGLKDVLIQFISNETNQIRGAYFRFTLYKAAQAIETAIKKRNVTTSMVVDESNIKEDFCTPLKLIIKAGGKVYQKTNHRNPSIKGNFEIMHHKFMIFDKNIQGKKLLLTGSFNATGQADLKNCENIIVIDDTAAIAQFEAEYNTVLKFSTQLTATTCVSAKGKDTDPDHKINFARDMNDIPQL